MNPSAVSKISPDLMAFPNLSEDLIFEIPLRLPVESLLRFKCVSKSCCSFISSSKFIKTHLEISSKDKQLNHHRVLMLPDKNPRTVYTYSLHASADGNSNQVAVALDFPSQSANEEVSYVDYINGFVCLHLETTKRLILWNPSTRKFRALPIAPSQLLTSCGFGYDESSDDYKAVLFNSYYDLSAQVYKIFSKVNSLKTNSFQNVTTKYSSGALCRHQKAKYCSGFLHCMAKQGDDISRITDCIVSFDIAAGTFATIPLPNFGSTNPNYSFTKLGECLAVLYKHKTSTDVYIMKDYPEKQWTKLISIPKDNLYFRRVPAFLFENGMILCCRFTRLELYNGREYLVQNFSIGCQQTPITYVESLTSPDNL